MLNATSNNYDEVGGKYSETRHAEPTIVSALSDLLEIDRGGEFVEIGCGVGNYAAALAEKGGLWTGLDISETMLAQAVRRQAPVNWRLGSAEAMPFKEGTFQGAVIINALHFFRAESALSEAFRTLALDGRLVIFTALPELVRRWWLAKYFPIMIDALASSLPSEARIHALLQAKGFEVEQTRFHHVVDDPVDLFVYAGKLKPEIYFDEVVRSNISQFRNFCKHEELSAGLALLRSDIDNGTFSPSMADSPLTGDYAFIVARK